ncbi:MAG: hypothetical protein KC609_21115 [Myxococcales bacterium]|nr:hypothetical protein [Myxococcales bacterium]
MRRSTLYFALIVALFLLAPLGARADESTQDATTPTDVEPGELQDVQIEIPIPNYKPTRYSKSELLRADVKAMQALKKRMQKQENPVRLLRAFIALQRTVRAQKVAAGPLLQWDLNFGLALVFIDISPILVPVAESYFRVALRHARALDGMKRAATYYNIACALSLQNRVKEAVEALRSTFEHEKALKVGHFFMMAQNDPTLSRVRGDKRYDALMKSLSKAPKKNVTTEKKEKP